jgi:uroporphyrinogen-III decarboxylase
MCRGQSFLGGKMTTTKKEELIPPDINVEKKIVEKHKEEKEEEKEEKEEVAPVAEHIKILKEVNQIESDIPVNHYYWRVRP